MPGSRRFGSILDAPLSARHDPGMKRYLVGGAVRDRLLGRPEGDRDYVVVGATLDAFLAAHPKAKPVGRHGKVAYIVSGCEYVLAEDLGEDLARRDLTVNALALDEETGEVVGLPGAREDLANRVLRPVSEANFFDDPLRVYRAARFEIGRASCRERV